MTQDSPDTKRSILSTVKQVNTIVTGDGSSKAGERGSGTSSWPLPADQAQGIAYQSVAQSAAMMVQDATNLFRNLSAIETTAIGIATANWIAQPENVAYLLIIEEAQRALKSAAELVQDAGKSAGSLLQSFKGSQT